MRDCIIVVFMLQLFGMGIQGVINFLELTGPGTLVSVVVVPVVGMIVAFFFGVLITHYPRLTRLVQREPAFSSTKEVIRSR